MDPTVQRYIEMLRRVFADRNVILGALPLAGSTRRVARLRELGAKQCFVLATGIGTGELPAEEDADRLVMEIRARHVVDELRQVERLFATPPPSVIAALDHFDPDREALVLLAPFAASTRVGDRPVYGCRRPGWVALEDKTACDTLFDAVGIARPDAALVAPHRSELVAASDTLDRGSGVVWSGDARDGFNGGGAFVRWIRPERPESDVADAVDHFASACDRVRVAPFIEGIPCSVHGFVCDDGVAVFRPVELVTLRPPTGATFQYAGAATYFDPPAPDRDEMRHAARRLGTFLSDRHGLRDAFTIDGILGADGWVPTELNPRFGAGLGYADAVVPDLTLDLLHHLVVAGDGPEVSAVELERLILPAADTTRWGGGWSTVSTSFTSTESTPIVFETDTATCQRADDPRDADGEIITGPGAQGGFVRITLQPERTPAGPSIAPRVVAALAFADRELDTSIGPLASPPAVR